MNTSRNNNRFNNNQKPKVAFKTVNLLLTGKDVNNVAYDVESCAAIINDLQNADVFNKVSIYVNAPRKYLTGNDTDKGTLSVAKIQSFDYNEGTMKIMMFGKNVQYADKIEADLALTVRVRTEKDSENVASILNFEIVPNTFAE